MQELMPNSSVKPLKQPAKKSFQRKSHSGIIIYHLKVGLRICANLNFKNHYVKKSISNARK